MMFHPIASLLALAWLLPFQVWYSQTMGSMLKVCIIGNGKLGSALFNLFTASGISTTCWDTLPERRTSPTETLTDAVSDASVVILSLSLDACATIIDTLKRSLKEDAIVVTLAKGFSKQGEPSVLFLRHNLPATKWVIWGGPMLHTELSTKTPGSAVLASNDPASALAIQDLLSPTTIATIVSLDPNGVSLAGILKNCYAIALSAAKECGFGDNALSTLLTACVEEMASIIPLFRGNANTAYGVAGMADLTATALSPISRHGSVGKEYARTGRLADCEGYGSIRIFEDILNLSPDTFPILYQLHQATLGQRPEVTADALWQTTAYYSTLPRA